MPPEFYRLLSETKLEPGQLKYNKLRSMVPRVKLTWVAAQFKQGKVILADARLNKYYNQAHVLGALSMPWDTLDLVPVKLPKRMPIVLYCR